MSLENVLAISIKIIILVFLPIKLTLSGKGLAVSGPEYLFRLLSNRKTIEVSQPRWKRTPKWARYCDRGENRRLHLLFFWCVSSTNPSGRHCEGGLRGSRETPVSSSSSWLSGEMCDWVCASRRRCRDCKFSSAPKTSECNWADVMSNTWITWT